MDYFESAAFIPLNVDTEKKYELKDFNINEKNYLLVVNQLVARNFTFLLNKSTPTPFASAAEINAIAIINLVYLKILDFYIKKIEPSFPEKIRKCFNENYTFDEQVVLLDSFYTQFPDRSTTKDFFTNFYLKSLIIDLSNENPALLSYKSIFDNSSLIANSLYQKKLKIELDVYKNGKSINSIDLLSFLKEPFKKYPNSIFEQLEFIKEKWVEFIPDEISLLLLAIDKLKEDYKPVWHGGDVGETQIPDLGITLDEYEAYSQDKDWMPKVIMLAKSTLVWLVQLSKKYKCEIKILSDVPDIELDELASYGITSLWLIGLWERSLASKKIKQICGNPDAEASAYSLHEYEISSALGGWEALHNLEKRCMKRGIRLSADMVPNHTAIDSKWISCHPDWFMQLPYNPYPQYSYNGVDLSRDSNIVVQLEDHYYNQSDCAVVFKRHDKNKGDTRYIYHGNDGTSMPWNDTAQINFLNPEAKEAVIQVILHVARNFHIIRFDAAMTLAKKHIQRLWYPAPGQGGDIPTRSENGMSTADFNNAMPIEFWREVVDRVSKEVPDTLLLAEAFWMMEGYFVRTLGMHRVYNSAFMNMLKKEENSKYRYLIKETLEFDPEILKRYVNFMNNPDEKTAAEQFGKGDKYFGVCMLLATMPGLPMIGHGQIEGYYEKYGMEFSKPHWDEQVDEYMVSRHKKEIFPIFRKRYLFSEVEFFRLYNFIDNYNNLNENVFAYSNICGNENVLLVYNNCYESTAGRVKWAVPYKDKNSNTLATSDLNDFVGLRDCYNKFVIFKEFKSGLSYIREASKFYDDGLFLMLAGYEYQLFTDFKIVEDNNEFVYKKLCEKLCGSGIKDIEWVANVEYYMPLHDYFKLFMNEQIALQLDYILKYGVTSNNNFFQDSKTKFLEEIKDMDDKEFNVSQNDLIESLGIMETHFKHIFQLFATENKSVKKFLLTEKSINKDFYQLFMSIILGKSTSKFFKRTLLQEILTNHELDRDALFNKNLRIKISIISEIDKLDKSNFYNLFDNELIRKFVGINYYNGVTWFKSEQMFELLYLWTILNLFDATKKEENLIIEKFFIILDKIQNSEYKLDILLKKE